MSQISTAAGVVAAGAGPPGPMPGFAQLVWSPGRLALGDQEFAVQPAQAPLRTAGLADGVFVVYKTPATMEAYARFWRATAGFAPRRVVELGIWAGGSAVLWMELLRPDRLVAIDSADADALESAYAASLARYVESQQGRLVLRWKTDQGDARRLRRIAREELGGPLDLVVDDASHLYSPTRRSFEALFPLVRPGGWYVIEDWNWVFDPIFRAPSHPWSRERPLADLVGELTALAGAAPDVARTVLVSDTIAAVERGPAPLGDDFGVERLIAQPPVPARRPGWRRVLAAFERIAPSGGAAATPGRRGRPGAPAE